MIKSIVNKYLKTFLGEIFLDAPNIQLSMGADLFSEAKIQMDNLSLRPDIFDIYLQPLKLISGHVGRLTVDGITNLAINGKLKFSAENIFLLFQIDTNSDAEHIQTLKKIQIEMQSGRFSDAIFKDLLEKLQGFTIGKDPDVDKKRKEVFKAMDTLFNGLNFSLKNIHIRVEMKQIQNINVGPYKSPSLYSSIGVMIPFVKFNPESINNNSPKTNRNNTSNKINFLMKNIHIYCDYDRDSYTSNGRSDISIANQFDSRYKTEKHYSIAAPFDIETSVSLLLKKKNGLLIPQFSFKVQSLRYFFDSQQVEVVRNFTELFSFSHKRFEQLIRMQKIFRNGFPLPRMFEVGGVKVLPHLLIRGKAYPTETKLSAVTTKSESLVMFMKERVGNKWMKMMWKHIIRLVLHDLKKVRPLGRWIEIAKLAFVRKEYAFTYSKLLKKSKETGLYSYDVNTNVRQELLRQLFEYEMMLPVRSTVMFRTLAVMVATVEDFNSKRVKAKQSQQPGKPQQAFEKISITWSDILRVFTEINEAKRESAFHRFDKNNFEDDHFLDDEVSTNRASDEGSVYSYSLHSRAPLSYHAPQPQSPVSSNVNNNNNITKSKNNNASPNITNTLRNSVKSVSSMQSTALKMMGSVGSSVNGAINGSSSNSTSSSSITTATNTVPNKFDDYDVKVSKKFDLSVFSDLFTTLNEKEEKVQEKEIKQIIQSDLASKEPIKLNLYDWHLGGSSPSMSTIAETSQWAMLRHQPSVVLMPPDVNITIDSLSVDVKTPINCGIREKIVSFIINSINCNVMISQSSNNVSRHSTNKSTNSNGTIRSLKGFASLSGALIQLRLVVKQFSTVIYIDKSTEKIQIKNSPVPLKSEKGSLLSTGLPLYPASESLNPMISSTLSSEQGDSNNNDDDSSDGASNSSESNSIALGENSSNLKFSEDSSDLKAVNISMNKPVIVAPVHISNSKTPLVGESAKTIESSHTIQSSNSNYIKVDTGSSIERKIIFSSKEDTFLILCIIMDLDDKGEGAADTQLQFGAVKVDLDKLSIATLVSFKSIENLTKIMKNFIEFRELLSILAESSVVIDRTSNLPVVEMKNHNQDDDMDIKALNRKAIIYNKNIHQWIGILEDMLPKVLSICVRFSKIEIDFVEYFVIRDFINSKIQLIIDRAALRLRHNSQINMLDSIVGVLSNMLNLNSTNTTKLRSKHHSKREEALLHPDNVPVRSSIVIPAIELVVAKSTTPYPLLDIHIKDLQIKVPITDDTLIFLIALIFSNILPFYY